MITPRFSLSQDDDHIIAQVDAPYVKFSEGEMWIQSTDFSFYCKPYHLKLHFSHEVVEDGTESAIYDIDSGKFTIKIPKQRKGETFRDLDMLTRLMTPTAKSNTMKASALIEVLDDTSPDPLESYDEDTIDWSVDQTFPDDKPCLGVESSAFSYGFNLAATGVFAKLAEARLELLDLEDPDKISLGERAVLETEHEKDEFNADHYQADLIDDETIQEIILYRTAASRVHSKIRKGKGSPDELIKYSQEEVESILRLPKKEYLMDPVQTKSALLGLVDILFAYLYDVRTTMEEPSVESAWTIRKLSATLSWLVSCSDLKSVLTTAVRRALCFPLYRHWVLAMKVLEDVCILFSLGRKQVLKCLLCIRSQFSNTELHHVLNDLYITDYCVWIQMVSEKHLISLTEQLEHFHLSKADLGLDLAVLEARCIESLRSSVEEDVDSDDIDSDDSSDSNGSASDDTHKQLVTKTVVTKTVATNSDNETVVTNGDNETAVANGDGNPGLLTDECSSTDAMEKQLLNLSLMSKSLQP